MLSKKNNNNTFLPIRRFTKGEKNITEEPREERQHRDKQLHLSVRPRVHLNVPNKLQVNSQNNRFGKEFRNHLIQPHYFVDWECDTPKVKWIVQDDLSLDCFGYLPRKISIHASPSPKVVDEVYIIHNYAVLLSRGNKYFLSYQTGVSKLQLVSQICWTRSGP